MAQADHTIAVLRQQLDEAVSRRDEILYGGTLTFLDLAVPEKRERMRGLLERLAWYEVSGSPSKIFHYFDLRRFQKRQICRVLEEMYYCTDVKHTYYIYYIAAHTNLGSNFYTLKNLLQNSQ